MFTSLKDFINTRLEENLVQMDLNNENGYFILVDQKDIYSILFFLKNDPDLKLALLDQIIGLPGGYWLWNSEPRSEDCGLTILYMLRSTTLPYRVTVIVEIEDLAELIPTVFGVFAGARWQEADIAQNFNVAFQESFSE